MARLGAIFALAVALFWGIDRFFPSLFPDNHFINAIYFASIAICIFLIIGSFETGADHLHRIPSAAVIGGILTIGGLAAYLVWSPMNPTPTVAAAAAVMATIGWVIQRDAAMFLNRKQHTLSILMQMRQSEIFRRHQVHLATHYPAGANLTPADVQPLLDSRKNKASYALDAAGGVTFPVADSILFLANFYEFLAAAVAQGDLDEALLKESIGNIATNFYHKIEPLLAHLQELDEDGKPTKPVYNYYWELRRRWSAS